MNTDKKLIEAFRVFMQKNVLPIIRTNDKVLKQWAYLNSVMGDDYLTPAKIDNYLVSVAPERYQSNANNNKSVTGIQMDPKVNNFAKKEFFDDNRSGVLPNMTASTNNNSSNSNDYRFVKPNNEVPLYMPAGGVDNYRNSGLSPNKFIDLNLSKDVSKDSAARLDDNNRRNLILILENFHTTLMSNQQKLENQLKKTSSKNGGVGGKDYSQDKRFY